MSDKRIFYELPKLTALIKKEFNHFLDEAMSSGAGLSDAPTLNDLKVAIGFTPEDVATVRAARSEKVLSDATLDALALVADRIEALLPPTTMFGPHNVSRRVIEDLQTKPLAVAPTEEKQ